MLYLTPKTLQRIKLNKTGIIKSKKHRQNILKFQHRFKMHNAQLSR